jgi:exonuclease SbcC
VRILELSLRNYRVFEEVELELPARVIGIFGPNGAGKSTLVESVPWALYGRARTPKNEIRTQGVLTDCVVRLVFEHSGRQYEIRRTIRGRNHSTDAELFVGDMQLAAGVTDVDAEIRRLLRMDQQVFRASVFAEQKQLDAFSDVTKGKRKEMVLRLLGIRPVDEARTAARKEARETRGQADKLAGALPDLEDLEVRLAAARTDAAQSQERAADVAKVREEADTRAGAAEKAFEESDRVREQAERVAALRAAAEAELDRVGKQSVGLLERIERLAAELEQLPALEAEHEGVAGARDRLAAGKKLAEVAEELAALEKELGQLPTVDPEEALAALGAAEDSFQQAADRASKAQAERDRLEAELRTAEETLDRAGELDPSEPCPTCGQPLEEGFDSYVAHCRAEVGRLKKAVADAAKQLKEAQAQRKVADKARRSASEAGTEVQKVVDRLAGLSERAERTAARVVELAEPFGGETPHLPTLVAGAQREDELDRRLTELRNERKHLEQLQRDAAKAATEKEGCEFRVAELDRQAAELAFDSEQHASLKKERDESRVLLEQARQEERAALERANELRVVVGRLEGELDAARATAAKVGELREDARYVERVSLLLDGFRDHLVARIGPELSREAEALFRELTNHEYEDLKIDDETLAIQIADAGEFFAIERFSGSETDLANLALRVAISAQLSRVSGADIGLMVLDEVLASLDAERKDLMVQTMGRLAGRFHQLFVITHAEQVKDQFPASIEIRKTGRRRSEAVLV